MIRFFSILILLFSLSFYSFSQDPYLDSLKNVVKDENRSQEEIISAYEELINNLAYVDTDEALKVAKAYWMYSKRHELKESLASCALMLGKIYETRDEYILANAQFENAIETYTKLGDSASIADAEKHIGIIKEAEGNYDEALQHYLKALKMFEDADDILGIASCKNGIGHIYMWQDKIDLALDMFNEALELLEQIDSPFAVAIVYNNIGLTYDAAGDISKAMDYFTKALEIQKDIGNTSGVTMCMTNIANLYSKDGAYSEAKKFYEDVLELKTQIGDHEGIARTHANLGIMYQDMGNLVLAKQYMDKAISIYEKIGSKGGLRDTYASLSGVHESSMDHHSALKYYKIFVEYKDSVKSDQSDKMVAELLELHNAEKREKENEILKKNNQLQKSELEKADEKSRRQTLQLTAALIGFVLILILAIVILRGYRQKKKANILLAEQNDEIKSQKEVIEEKNRDIMDSIKYAKRIQEAILPPDKVVKATLDNSFILFKPKDIVSGDFYWMETKNNKILFSAVDCTGHGVPGAFMSIVGHNGLNQAVNEYGIMQPGKILDKLNELVKETLHQTDKADVKDGMDLALCVLDLDNKIGEYSGANNPLYIIRKKGVELKVNDEVYEAVKETEEYNLFEIKATKQPIGAYDDTKDFVNNVFQLMEGDRLYVFSDGFPDQFGGPKNKKFKYSTFKVLLLDEIGTPMSDQKVMLDKTIEDWMGGVEQIDDICIIGVEI